MIFNVEDAIVLLGNTPSILRQHLGNLPEAWTSANEGPDTWSPYDVVGHLIHGEKTDWIPRLETILGSSTNKTFEPYDRFAQFKENNGKTLGELLVAFEQLRASNLKILKSKKITPAQLDLQGIHPELGPVTLRQLLAAWVVHDQGHIAQIARVLAKQYRDEVGPWPKYLTILKHTPSE